jgi:hypothetical protein
MYILGCLRMYFKSIYDIRLYILESRIVSVKREKKHHLKTINGISVVHKYLK